VLLGAAALAVLAVVAAIVLIFFAPWPDANHRSAVDVARNAGVPTSVLPGPKP
jgi:hypothetical protein